jgi:hypothetical protein
LGGSRIEIAKELVNALANTTKNFKVNSKAWTDVRSRWQKMMRRGYAIRQLEEALQDMTPTELRHLISQDSVEVGELLWQGTSGFCVATRPFLRSQDLNTNVIKLQGKSDEVAFRAEFAIPIRALIDESFTTLRDSLGERPRMEISSFIDEIAKGFAVT